jgi:hypothetical protein
VLKCVARFTTVCYGVGMILSEYTRRDSPFVWIQYGTCAADKRCIKTAIRKDDRERKRKVASELNRIERQLLPLVSDDRPANGDGWKWVDAFLATRYAARPGSFDAYRRQWHWLRLFLRENEIASPAMVTRELLFEYPAWRKLARSVKREPRLATAILGLKLMGIVLDEALNRGLIANNPARKLNIHAEETALRPEITDEMFAVIWRELQTQPDWMRKSFFLAINTGLRFATTRLHRSQIRKASDDMLIEKPKGGRKREFAIPIYDSIREMIDGFMRSRDEYIWTAPERGEGSLTGLAWSKFFRQSAAYVPALCFHSTRVTFITRGMRAGIPEPVMMKMVNHASKDVSRIYQRWTSADVRQFAGQIPSLVASGALT